MALKDNVENNAVVWVLGTLLTGFLAGIGTYHWGLEFTGRRVVSENTTVLSPEQMPMLISEYQKLQQDVLKAKTMEDEVGPIKARENFYRTFLAYLISKEPLALSEAARDRSKQAFVDLIAKNYQATASGNVAEQDTHIAIVKKGQDWISGTATLKGDPTPWPLPQEINEAVHQLHP